jgi:predicted dehydrogenase
MIMSIADAKSVTIPLTRRTTPRLGFLGVGWIGQHRLQSIVHSGQAEIAAICDTAPELAAKAAVLAPSAAVVTSFDRLLDLGLDGIVIATPSALHAEQSMAALERGIAVFCQKPLGRNAGETRAVIDAARKADKLLGVDLSYRFTAGMQAIRQLIRQNKLGKIYAADLVFHNAYGPDKPWFFDPKLSGGGCVIDLGIHLVDLALWCLDFPRAIHVTSRLFCQGVPLKNCQEGIENFGFAQIDLYPDIILRLACSWNLSIGADAEIRASFYGTEGGAEFRNVNGSFFDFTADHFRGTKRVSLTRPPEDWGGNAAVDWVRRLADNSRFNPDIETLGQVSEILDEIYCH